MLNNADTCEVKMMRECFFLREHQLCKQNSSKIDFCELTYNNTYDVVKLLLSTRSALHSFHPLFFFLSISSACSVLLVTQRHSSSEDIDSRLWIMEVEPETRLLVRGSVRQKHRAAVLTSPGLSEWELSKKPITMSSVQAHYTSALGPNYISWVCL